MAKLKLAKEEIYGIGNHGPFDKWHDPLDAFQSSQTISYPPAQHERWVEFLLAAAQTREYDHLMTDEERKALEVLPARVTVYRGIRTKKFIPDVQGLSWTLSREVAKRFAETYRQARWGDPDGEPIVLEKIIRKEQIVWLLLGRDEQEVVICPIDQRN